jgi:hypothetical protein
MTRLTRLLLAVVLLAPTARLAWQFRDLPHLGLYHDDGQYVVSARALATTGEYRIDNLPGRPWQGKYPVGYPALLALAWWAGDLRWMVLLTWMWLPVLVWLSWRVFGQFGLPERWRWGGCALVALQPIGALLSVTPMSEVPFTALVAGAILLAESDWAATAGLAAAGAFLVRTAGVPLLITVPLCYGLARKWRQAGRFVAAMAPVVAAWQVWVVTHRNPGRDLVTLYYTDYTGFRAQQVTLADLPTIVWVNLDSLFSGAGRLFFFENLEAIWVKLVAWVIAVAAVAGIVKLVRGTGRRHYAAFAGVYAALLVVWHYPPDRRFVYPLLPLLVAGVFAQVRAMLGAQRPARQRADRIGNAVVAGAALCAVAVAVGSLVWGTAVFLPDFLADQRRDTAAVAPVYGWIREHLPRDAALVAYDDAPVFLATGRRAVGFPIPPRLVYRNDPAAARAYAANIGAFAAEQHAGYALVTPNDFRRDLHEDGRDALAGAVSRLSGAELLYSGAGYGVFRLPAPVR